MEFRIPFPADAIDVENLICSKCQHFGYPGAKIDVDPSTKELILRLHDMDPLPSPSSESFSSRPRC